VETIPGHLERLPDGGDRGRAEMLSRDQRERILAAIVGLVAKRGYQGTTVEHIVKKAGVSRATFYEIFENREACLLAAFAEAEAELHRRVDGVVDREDEWPAQVRAALTVFLELTEEHPAVVRTCLVEAVTAGPAFMEHYERALNGFAPLFRRGREYSGLDPSELPEDVEDMIVGGLVWMVHQRVQRNDIAEIKRLLPTMVEFALVPYLGEARAEELANN
jgi:AcrR family transcriptional regulator